MKSLAYKGGSIETYYSVALCLFLLIPSNSSALIHFAADNGKNLSAPAHNDLPFDSIGRICNQYGKNTSGTAVHIRDGYMLTANHVKVRTHVTFDGNKFYKIDTSFAPIKVANADFKIIRLSKHPDLPPINLFDKPHGDTNVTGWIVGWGLGCSEIAAEDNVSNTSRL